jgi:hypothetical protein
VRGLLLRSPISNLVFGEVRLAFLGRGGTDGRKLGFAVLVAAPEYVSDPLWRDPWPARSGAPRGKADAGFTKCRAKYGDKPSTLTWFATLAAPHGMYWVQLLLPRPLVNP